VIGRGALSPIEHENGLGSGGHLESRRQVARLCKKSEVELLAADHPLEFFNARLRPGQFDAGRRGVLGGRRRTGQGGPRRIARRHAAPAPRLWSSPDSNRLTVCTLNVLEKMRIG
jgi:hypothetical protein